MEHWLEYQRIKHHQWCHMEQQFQWIVLKVLKLTNLEIPPVQVFIIAWTKTLLDHVYLHFTFGQVKPNVNMHDPSHDKNIPIMSVTGSINHNVFNLIKLCLNIQCLRHCGSVCIRLARQQTTNYKPLYLGGVSVINKVLINGTFLHYDSFI